MMQYPGFNPNQKVEKTDVNVIKKIQTQLGVPWKSFIAFAGVFFGQLIARATVNGIPVIPETAEAWWALIGGSLVSAGIVYLKGNVYTEPQAEKKLTQAQEKLTG